MGELEHWLTIGGTIVFAVIIIAIAFGLAAVVVGIIDATYF